MRETVQNDAKVAVPGIPAARVLFRLRPAGGRTMDGVSMQWESVHIIRCYTMWSFDCSHGILACLLTWCDLSAGARRARPGKHSRQQRTQNSWRVLILWVRWTEDCFQDPVPCQWFMCCQCRPCTYNAMCAPIVKRRKACGKYLCETGLVVVMQHWDIIKHHGEACANTASRLHDARKFKPSIRRGELIASENAS